MHNEYWITLKGPSYHTYHECWVIYMNLQKCMQFDCWKTHSSLLHIAHSSPILDYSHEPTPEYAQWMLDSCVESCTVHSQWVLGYGQELPLVHRLLVLRYLWDSQSMFTMNCGLEPQTSHGTCCMHSGFLICIFNSTFTMNAGLSRLTSYSISQWVLRNTWQPPTLNAPSVLGYNNESSRELSPSILGYWVKTITVHSQWILS